MNRSRPFENHILTGGPIGRLVLYLTIFVVVGPHDMLHSQPLSAKWTEQSIAQVEEICWSPEGERIASTGRELRGDEEAVARPLSIIVAAEDQ